MLRKIRVLLEHHRNIRQGTGSNQERSVLRCRHQGLVHGIDELEIRSRGLNGLRQERDAVQARLAWLCSAVCFEVVVVPWAVTVDVGGVDSIADLGLVGAAVDFDVALSYGFEDASRVEGRLF